MADELLKIPYALRLSRATMRNIRANIAFSIVLKGAFLVLAVAGVRDAVDGGRRRHGRVADRDRERAAAVEGVVGDASARDAHAFRLLKKCWSTNSSIAAWSAGSTFSNCRPIPTRRSLQATRDSASMSRFDPGSRNRALTFDPLLERAHRADGEAALAQVQRQRRGDRVAEAVGDRDAEDDARAAAAVEVVGKQVRRERRQDVLHGAVFVDVAGDAERGELAHLVGAGDRAAEHQDRQPPVVELADRADQLDAAGVRQPQVEHDQVDPVEIGADARQQLRRALDGAAACARRRARAVAKRSRTNAVSSATMTVLVRSLRRCRTEPIGHGDSARELIAEFIRFSL